MTSDRVPIVRGDRSVSVECCGWQDQPGQYTTALCVLETGHAEPCYVLRCTCSPPSLANTAAHVPACDLYAELLAGVVRAAVDAPRLELGCEGL